MASKIVDVFDGSGVKLFTYSIALEDADCLDAEYEEGALILAEASGMVSKDEIAEISARCDVTFVEDAAVQIAAPPRPKRQKSAVVSLVRHRMKRAGINRISQNRRRAL